MPTDHFTQLFYRAYFLEHLKTASQFAEYVSEVLTALKWLVIDQNGKSVTGRRNIAYFGIESTRVY